MSFSLRPLLPGDIGQTAEIDREAFPTMWPPTNYRRELANNMAHYIVLCDNSRLAPKDERAASTLTGRLRAFFLRGAAHQDTLTCCVAGYGGLWIVSQEAHITSIAVREAYRRRGLGEFLFFNLLQEAIRLGVQEVTLEVRVSNIIAQNLYLKYGFATKGVRRNYYLDNREDALVMTLADAASPVYAERLSQFEEQHAHKWGRFNGKPV
jgi:ribosomal-protein-alanine N-acetyltransferase